MTAHWIKTEETVGKEISCSAGCSHWTPQTSEKQTRIKQPLMVSVIPSHTSLHQRPSEGHSSVDSLFSLLQDTGCRLWLPQANIYQVIMHNIMQCICNCIFHIYRESVIG